MKSLQYLATVLAALFFISSCKKQTDAPIKINTDQVVIDSVDVIDLTTIQVSASLHIMPTAGKFRLGVCWSKAPNPTAKKDTIFQPISNSLQLDTTIKNLDSNTVYHLRAFCILSADTVYSADKLVKTGKLSIVFEKAYAGYPDDITPQIKQVIAQENNGFIVLSEVLPMYSGNPWSRLTKIDLSGNTTWTYDYDANENKEPDALLEVADGYVFSAHSNGLGVSSAFIYKTDLNGKLLWEKELKDTAWTSQIFDRLYKNSASEIVLTTRGKKYDNASGTYDSGPILKYQFDENGNLPVGVQYLNNPGGILILDVTTPPSANGYLKVFYNTDSINSYGFKVQKFSPSDALDWDKSFYPNPYSHEEIPMGCLENNNGNYTLLISSLSDAQLRVLDKNNGNILWQSSYQNLENGYGISTNPLSFTLSPQNDYYLAGIVPGQPFVMKINSKGKYIWNFTFSYPYDTNATPYVIFVYPNNEIYLFSIRNKLYGNGTMFLTKLQEY